MTQRRSGTTSVQEHRQRRNGLLWSATDRQLHAGKKDPLRTRSLTTGEDGVWGISWVVVSLEFVSHIEFSG